MERDKWMLWVTDDDEGRHVHKASQPKLSYEAYATMIDESQEEEEEEECESGSTTEGTSITDVEEDDFSPEQALAQFERRWGGKQSAQRKLAGLCEELSDFRWICTDKSLVRAWERIVDKLLTPGDLVVFHCTVKGLPGFPTRECRYPDYCTTQKQDVLSSATVQNMVIVKRDDETLEECLSRATCYIQRVAEIQFWRRVAQCLIVDKEKVTMVYMNVTCEGRDVPITARINFSASPSYRLGTNRGVLVIDHFLHLMPEECAIPMRFIEPPNYTYLGLDGKVDSISPIRIAETTAVYELRQGNKSSVIKMFISRGPHLDSWMIERDTLIQQQEKLFRRELRALTDLRSLSGVCSLEGFSEPSRCLLLTYHGKTLSHASGQQDNWCMSGFERVLQTLREMHEDKYGFVHRDVAPSNIACSSDGEFTLIDFGFAELLDGPRRIVTGRFRGTVMYASQAHLLDVSSHLLEYSASTDLQSFVKTLVSGLLSPQAKSKMLRVGANPINIEDCKEMHDLWEKVFETMPDAKELYDLALKADYDGILKVIKRMSSWAFQHSHVM